jgi:hypothetical protein
MFENVNMDALLNARNYLANHKLDYGYERYCTCGVAQILLGAGFGQDQVAEKEMMGEIIPEAADILGVGVTDIHNISIACSFYKDDSEQVECALAVFDHLIARNPIESFRCGSSIY